MKTLLILYMIYLSWGTIGQGRVSILEMSRYLRRSKSQTKKDLLFLADEGLVHWLELFSPSGAKKYYVELTSKGDDHLMLNFDAARDMYHQHVAETVLVMKAKMKDVNYEPRKMTAKERAALAYGQKKMFEDDDNG